MSKKGTVFITVLIISMVLIFVSVSVSNMLVQDAHMIRYLKYSTQALYIAEAGINDALARVIASLSEMSFSSTLGEGSYDVVVDQIGTRWLVSSDGTIKGVTRTAATEIKALYPEALNNALATAGDISIKSVQGSVAIKGDIHANGNLLLKEQGPNTTLRIEAEGEATGKATSSGSYDASAGNVVIADAANSGGGKPIITLPTFNFGYFEGVAMADGTHYSSDQTFNNASITGGTAGITYVDGDVSFSGNCTIQGGFVASGDVELNNGNSITQTHDTGNRFPIFMSDGACKLYGRFDTQEGNIVYATNSMKIRTPGGQSAVLGSVISGGWMNVVANNSVTLTYSEVEAPEVVPEGIEIVSWTR